MRRRMMLAVVAVFAIFVYAMPAFAESEQIKDEIIYEIIVDRFNNGDYSIDYHIDVEDPKAYQGGDIKGITLKLDDLYTLGVTTLSLAPIMENADKGFHGYWIEDFKAIDEQMGSRED